MNVKEGLLPLLVLVSASCSLVKEQREQCPSVLSLTVTGVRGETVVSVYGGGVKSDVTVSADTVLLTAVPQGLVEVVAVSGASLPLRIPPGSDCPVVYAGHVLVDVQGEECSAGVQLYKQFCTLTMETEGPPGTGVPWTLAVSGRVSGMLPDCSPAPGEFSCPAGESSTAASVRLPRQSPSDPLWLTLVSSASGESVKTFSLGELLLRSGYDWTAPDLPDVTLSVRLSLTGLSISLPTTPDIHLDLEI